MEWSSLNLKFRVSDQMEIKLVMEQLIKEQFKTYDRLKKLQQNFKANPSACKGDIAVRIEVISNYYNKFCETHDGIEKILSKHKIDVSNEEYIVGDLAFKCELLYLEMKGKLLEEPSDEDKKEERISLDDLPKIDVPKFSGKPTDWLAFRKEYSALVHGKSNLKNSQKFRYLQSALPNEVFEWIKDLFTTGDETGYGLAWKVLEEKFNRRVLVDAYLSELLEEPSEKFSIENSDLLLHTTKRCLQGLQIMNIDIKNWDVLLIHLLVGKLNEETKSLWMKTHSCHEVPKLEKFCIFLRSKDTLDGKCEDQKSSVNASNFNISCVCCKERHNLWECDKFELLGIDDRRLLVRKNACCMRCLSESHTILDCWRSYTCRICQRKDHHYLLHKNAKPNKKKASGM